MAHACEENKGCILPRAEIHCGFRHLMWNGNFTPFDNKTLYICIKKYGSWSWAPFEQSSVKTMKEYRNEIYNTLQDTFSSRKVSPHTLPIKISDSSGSNASQINGTFYLVPEQEKGGSPAEKLPVYVCMKNFPPPHPPEPQIRYIYIVKRESSGNTYRIWLGNSDNMKRSRQQGWLRSKNYMPLGEVQCPWKCKDWEIWDGPDGNGGNWIVTPTIKVEIAEPDKIYPENSAQIMELLKKSQDTEKKTFQINKKLNQAINKLHDTNKAYTDMSCLLYNKMNKEERQEFLKKSPKFIEIFHKNDICVCCLAVGKKTKCLHFDCAGACKKCREKENKLREVADAAGASCDEYCCACGQKQELRCPICFEDFRRDYMDIFKCKHGVCYGCCWKSVKAKKSIKKCPTCRRKI